MDHKNRKYTDPARPYERCLAHGASALTDAELIAVILRTGTRGLTAEGLAGRVLDLCPAGCGLPGLSTLTLQQLLGINGIGEGKAVQLMCLAELASRAARQHARSTLTVRDSGTVAGYYMEHLRHDEQENVICMMLDSRCHFIGDELITRGTCSEAPLSTRDLFLAAIRWRAVNIVLVHNHPSGDPTPSRADILITEKVREAGELLDISLVDHIIIGDRRYVSLADDGYWSPGTAAGQRN